MGIVVAVVAASLCFGHVGAQDSRAPDVAHGRHIATALATCTHCHGVDFAGGLGFPRDGSTVYAANLTPGVGGIAAYSDSDLRRAIRGGRRPDGTALRVMPWRAYAVMTDRDVDDLIAFLRSVPAVDRTIARAPAPPPAPPAAPDEGANRPPPTGGAYIARIGGCTGCHGAGLTGGERFGNVVAPNISHAGIGTWSFADFTTAMRTGKTPAGRTLSPVMPWASIGTMTDDELRELYDFLESQPAVAN